jgi:hypothetical protein
LAQVFDGTTEAPSSPSFDLSVQTQSALSADWVFACWGISRRRLSSGRTRLADEGEMMRRWTEAETRRLRAWIRKKVSAEEIAKTLDRYVGSVKKAEN